MKYHPTEEFTRKAAALASTGSLIRELTTILSVVQKSTLSQLLTRTEAPRTMRLGPNIFATISPTMFVYFTLADSEGREEALLLDLALAASQHTTVSRSGTKDPRVNTTLNPLINTALNPLINTSLNPRVNTTLNPLINTSLNPLINTSLNPLINTSLNPLINTSLNPLINTSLNPLINVQLNPSVNPGFDGPFIYDKALKRLGYLVRASEPIMLQFDMNAAHVGIAVADSQGGFVLFDRHNQWTGYLVRHGHGGYLMFGKNGNWDGFAV